MGSIRAAHLGNNQRVTRALRAVSFVGLIAWPFVYTFGPNVSDGGVRWGLWPAVLLVVATCEARLISTGQASSLVALWTGLWRLWQADGTRWVLGCVLVTRLAVLGVGYVTAERVPVPDGSPGYSGPTAWSMSARWDAFWYLNIAVDGYQWNAADAGQQNVAFFPAFPVLMRVGGELVTIPAHLVDDPGLFGTFGLTRILLGGVLVNLVAFTAALLLLYRLIRLDADSDVARWGVAFAACLPFGLFFSAPYTESIFLLGIVGAVLSVRGRQWPAAVCWGLLVGLTRPNGFLLAVPLALIAFTRCSQPIAAAPRMPWRISAAMAPIMGLAGHMIYLWCTVGDPLAWSHAQAAWGRSLSMTGLVETRLEHIASTGVVGYIQQYPYEVANTLMLACTLVLGWRSRHIAWPYAVLVAVALLPAILIDLPAIGRMTAPLFPVPLALAISTRGRARPITAGVLLLAQLILASRFYAWKSLN